MPIYPGQPTPGRTRIGREIKITLPDDIIDAIDQYIALARLDNTTNPALRSRSAFIRDAVTTYVRHLQNEAKHIVDNMDEETKTEIKHHYRR